MTSGLSFVADIERSYLETLWLHSYCKSEVLAHYNNHMPLLHGITLQNIANKAQAKLQLKKNLSPTTPSVHQTERRLFFKEKIDRKYKQEAYQWEGLAALQLTKQIDELMEMIASFERKLINVYDLMLSKKIKYESHQAECVETVRLRDAIEKRFEYFQNANVKCYRINLALVYFNKILLFSNKKDLKLPPADNAWVINNETFIKRQIILLKVGLTCTSIEYASTSALELFEVHSFEELASHSITQFMPPNIAKNHDSYIVGRSDLEKVSKSGQRPSTWVQLDRHLRYNQARQPPQCQHAHQGRNRPS